MAKQQEVDKHESPTLKDQADKKPYTKPVLRHLGTVQALTQGKTPIVQ